MPGNVMSGLLAILVCGTGFWWGTKCPSTTRPHVMPQSVKHSYWLWTYTNTVHTKRPTHTAVQTVFVDWRGQEQEIQISEGSWETGYHTPLKPMEKSFSGNNLTQCTLNGKEGIALITCEGPRYNFKNVMDCINLHHIQKSSQMLFLDSKMR